MKKTAIDSYKEFAGKLMSNLEDIPSDFNRVVDEHWEELVGSSDELYKIDYLFESGSFKLHSGETSTFKIECDALKPHSMKTLCSIIAEKYTFGKVVGVPTGGIRIAKELEQYCLLSDELILIVDDVLTTGDSMKELRQRIELESPNSLICGVVLFARGKCPEWVDPLFKMWEM